MLLGGATGALDDRRRRARRWPPPSPTRRYILVADTLVGRSRPVPARRAGRHRRRRDAVGLRPVHRPLSCASPPPGGCGSPRSRSSRRCCRSPRSSLGLERVGPATASIVSTVEPVVTVALAMALFGERLGPRRSCAGGVLRALVAVVLLQAKVRARCPSRSRPRCCPSSRARARRLPDGDGWAYEPKCDGFRARRVRRRRRGRAAVAQRQAADALLPRGRGVVPGRALRARRRDRRGVVRHARPAHPPGEVAHRAPGRRDAGALHRLRRAGARRRRAARAQLRRAPRGAGGTSPAPSS